MQAVEKSLPSSAEPSLMFAAVQAVEKWTLWRSARQAHLQQPSTCVVRPGLPLLISGATLPPTTMVRLRIGKANHGDIH